MKCIYVNYYSLPLYVTYMNMAYEPASIEKH